MITGSSAAKVAVESASATAACNARKVVFMGWLSVDEADGERFTVRGVEHLGPHGLAGAVGGDRQAPVRQQRARKFGSDHRRAGFQRDAVERLERQERLRVGI